MVNFRRIWESFQISKLVGKTGSYANFTKKGRLYSAGTDLASHKLTVEEYSGGCGWANLHWSHWTLSWGRVLSSFWKSLLNVIIRVRGRGGNVFNKRAGTFKYAEQNIYWRGAKRARQWINYAARSFFVAVKTSWSAGNSFRPKANSQRMVKLTSEERHLKLWSSTYSTFDDIQ